MENLKVKANFIDQRVVSKDDKTHVFAKFSSRDLGMFQVYVSEPFTCNYLDEFLLMFKPSVFNNNLQLNLDSYKKA